MILPIQLQQCLRLNRRYLSTKLRNGPGLEEFINGTAEALPGDGRLPPWLKTPIAIGKHFTELTDSLKGLNLHTVQPLVDPIYLYALGVSRSKVS